jgi:hypothetical protein
VLVCDVVVRCKNRDAFIKKNKKKQKKLHEKKMKKIKRINKI